MIPPCWQSPVEDESLLDHDAIVDGSDIGVSGYDQISGDDKSMESLKVVLYGEPESYTETWEEGSLATSGEVSWSALFIVKEFDHWEIGVGGTESEGLKGANGRWADRREFDGWTIEYWTRPPGQPLGVGSVADPLRQLGRSS